MSVGGSVVFYAAPNQSCQVCCGSSMLQAKNGIAKLWTAISANDHIIHVFSTDDYGAIIAQHLLLLLNIVHINTTSSVLNKNSSVLQSQTIISSGSLKKKNTTLKSSV